MASRWKRKACALVLGLVAATVPSSTSMSAVTNSRPKQKKLAIRPQRVSWSGSPNNLEGGKAPPTPGRSRRRSAGKRSQELRGGGGGDGGGGGAGAVVSEEALRAYVEKMFAVSTEPKAGGQGRYQTLHETEMEDGVERHRRDLGLGSELELARDDSDPSGFSTRRATARPEWARLEAHAREITQKLHLRDLVADPRRSEALALDFDGTVLDWSRQKVTKETMALLFELARAMDVEGKMKKMRGGDPINKSEGRAVMHWALRAPPRYVEDSIGDDGVGGVVGEAVEAACAVRDRIFAFADGVRSGAVRNVAGDRFETVIVVGIGGSYLGPEFVAEAVAETMKAEDRLGLRFVANVDPTDFRRATRGVDPKRSLVVVVSKSWSTRETKRNADLVREWVLDAWRGEQHDVDEGVVVRSQFAACSSRAAQPLVEAWGVDVSERLFEFWDWVGGRYSSSASAGVLPLALVCGSDKARAFLAGANAVDDHFFNTALETNLPAIMALLGVWNVNFLGLSARAVVSYSDALARFAAHVQQLEMESNGKGVSMDGRPLDYTTGEIVFGEPGTNAQHSFFQLLHMGQCVPCDFIGVAEAPTKDVDGHNELMANFFAQPDALAVGRTFDDVLRTDAAQGRRPPSKRDQLALGAHRTLSGDRPSITLLLPKLDAYRVGTLLALYEHRAAVQGFVWDINSWDQWGVELGKKLADDLRNQIEQRRPSPAANPSTRRLLQRYLDANNKGPP